MKKMLVALCIVLIIPGCKTPQHDHSGEFLCREHASHHMENRAEFASCFGFDAAQYDEYMFYSEMQETSSKENIETAVANMKESLENKIVSFVMKRITTAMGQQEYRHWTFDNMRIPAVFRTFVKNKEGKYTVKTIAAMKKRDFTPRGIIMYLPLEYKMHLLRKKKGE
ncbi:MAG TPA: hypothetical protein PK544_03740 [Spirochaetota bacterium]|nr:hypothetical protein [Spirochaetota bacterium]HPJ39179.1 hypothetical protein [Spirochaetota bacterium]HPQ52623.1 hypothetical protein [Spirochaetota bacterium]